MRRIAQSSHGLKWAEVSARQHELRAGDELVATLGLQSRFGTLAKAESGDGCFTFKRVGFWQSRASIRACDSEAEVALFTNNTWASGGTLEFPDGRRYKATTNAWMTRLEFTSESEERLVGFHYGGFFRRKADVELSSAALQDPHLHLLVTFGWYLAVMLSNDAAALTAITTSS